MNGGAAWGTEGVVPLEFLLVSALHRNDEVLSQGGEEEPNPEGIWKMPKPTAKILQNKTTTSKRNPFAETMVWGRVRNKRNAVLGELSYSEAVKRLKVENNDIRYTQARSRS